MCDVVFYIVKLKIILWNADVGASYFPDITLFGQMNEEKNFSSNNMILDVQMCKICFKDMAFKAYHSLQDNMKIFRS